MSGFTHSPFAFLSCIGQKKKGKRVKRKGNSGDNERWETEKGKVIRGRETVVIMRGGKQRKGRG